MMDASLLASGGVLMQQDDNGDLHPCAYLSQTVMIEDPPISFSPFSLVDCTMLNHFSFNDFVAIAFPDLAGDLDTRI